MMDFLWENVLKKKQKERSLTRVLGENILFKDLSPFELQFVENIVHERQYRKGETVFRQGEVGVGMYIVVAGSVDIVILDRQTEPDKHQAVTRLEPGDFFGEISLVEENGRRSATALASEDSILIGFFKPDLLEILERNPAVGVKVVFRLAEVLGRRLRETTDKITALKKDLTAWREKKA